MRAMPLVALASLTGTLFAGCAQPAAKDDVIASFYPLQFLTDRIVQGHLRVGVLIPFGVEPHEYDLKPSDAARLQGARLIVLQGAGLESFRDKVETASRERGTPLVVATQDLALAPASTQGVDPHTWLDPVLAKAEARAIQAALARVDPATAAAYATHAEALAFDLDALDQEYAAGLAHCAKPRIITTHAAFGYLAKRYHFTQFAISGLEPEAEPSAEKVREAADLAKRENITVIFFETLVSPRVAQVVADEVHGRTEVLDPIEGLTPEAQAAGASYLTVMRSNLAHLRDAMECS